MVLGNLGSGLGARRGRLAVLAGDVHVHGSRAARELDRRCRHQHSPLGIMFYIACHRVAFS
jgi:hypothetical protein